MENDIIYQFPQSNLLKKGQFEENMQQIIIEFSMQNICRKKVIPSFIAMDYGESLYFFSMRLRQIEQKPQSYMLFCGTFCDGK